MRASCRRIVVGVAGGIAAYKSADLVRRLREREIDVRVVMTRAACEFVTPLTMQALSGHPVHVDLFDRQAEAAMGHIELARWAEFVLIAPATANIMAKIVHGLADDLLSTLCLASPGRLLLAPAMNRQMWRAAATEANRRVLDSRGVAVFGPAEGSQACGDTGPGRMIEPAEIVERLLALCGKGELTGVRVLLTAGPTRESIDPVRFLSNHSSGKMGYAIASAILEAGGTAEIVSGPTSLAPPCGARVVQVESANEMRREVMVRVHDCDIFVGVAAVADYRPEHASQQKIKKNAERISMTLTRNPDILAEVAGLPNAPFAVGFAAETNEVERHAREKLDAKGLDLIAANQVGVPGSGFAGDENALQLFWPGGRRELPRAPKTALARSFVAVLAERFHAARASTDS